MIIVFITCKNEKEAIKISKALLRKRHIACANIFPIKSVFRWKGKITEEDEVVLLAKTKDHKFEEIQEVVEKLPFVPPIVNTSS